MSIPKKGSRSVIVRGTKFRWRVRSKPTNTQGVAESPLVLAVEQEGCRGSVLVVELDQLHPSNWSLKPAPGVTPEAVANYICQALEAGWKSSAKGAQFRLKEPFDYKLYRY
jgi:hypothetical protein